MMFQRKTDRPGNGRTTAARMLFYTIAIAGIATLVGLGCWQLERLAWKTSLIHSVNARVNAAAEPAPGPEVWPGISSERDAYRHITIRGVLNNGAETLVHASTIHGAGYWVMTPLLTDAGFTVLVNRGFVPPDHRAPATRPEGQIRGETTVTGLLRITEPGGGFLRANDPENGRWYSRDVAAIAASRQLIHAAPYFIDADATPNPGGLPIGGLTVITFYNNHLQYALTWFILAGMLLFYILLAACKPQNSPG